jgi:hypothetical protein
VYKAWQSGYNGLVELTKSAEHVDGASGQDNIEHTIHSIVNAQLFKGSHAIS